MNLPTQLQLSRRLRPSMLMCALGFATSLAHAEPDLDAAKRAFAEGKTLYAEGKKREAATKFRESYRQSQNPLLLYNIGLTFDEAGDTTKAILYYRKYLSDAPATAPHRDVVTARITAIEAELIELEDAPAQPTTAPSAAETFMHTAVEEAPPGKPIDISAYLPKGRGQSARLYFRAANEAAFTQRRMSPRYNEVVARIPASKTRGTAVHYYLEVRDANDKIIERHGKPTSPNLIMIDDVATARFYPDFRDTGETHEAPMDAPRFDERDAPASRLGPAKWVATASSAALLGAGVVFFVRARNAEKTLLAESAASAEGCPGGAPCQVFDAYLADAEATGRQSNTLATWSLALGAGTTAVAAYLWYRDRTPRRTGQAQRLHISPTVAQHQAGAMATWDF